MFTTASFGRTLARCHLIDTQPPFCFHSSLLSFHKNEKDTFIGLDYSEFMQLCDKRDLSTAARIFPANVSNLLFSLGGARVGRGKTLFKNGRMRWLNPRPARNF